MLQLRRRALAGAVVVFAGLGAGACRETTVVISAAVTRSDSAGIAILTLEDSLPAYANISASDTLRLRGTPEGLFGNNPQIVVPLRDGRTLLSDAEVVGAYDSTGAYTGIAIAKGRGPGEVATLAGIWHTSDDSLWVNDMSTRRISRFGADLRFARSVEAPRFGETSAFSIFGWLNADTTAVVEFSFSDPSGGPGLLPIEYRIGTWVLGGDAKTTEARQFGVMQRFAPGVIPNGISISPPFSPTAVWVGYGRCMVYGFADRWAMRIEAPDGAGRFSSVAELRAPRALAAEVTPERKEAYIRRLVARMPAAGEIPRTQFERALRDHATFPARVPSFTRVLVSADGALWVQRYRDSIEERDAWTIVDVHGARAWRFELPPGSRLLGVRPQGALIAARDADELETQYWLRLPELADIRLLPACRSAS